MTEKMFVEITEWQDKTFAKESALSCAKHLRKEIDELIHEIENDGDVPYEITDVLLLAFGTAHKMGMSYETICRIINGKMEINRSRKWGEPNEEGFVEHIKEDAKDWPCPSCDEGEMKQIGMTQPNGQTNYECSSCGHAESYP
jgi:predicted RNA-binding Zn-ribbon protein involved in translation (DUF1610 family)